MRQPSADIPPFDHERAFERNGQMGAVVLEGPRYEMLGVHRSSFAVTTAMLQHYPAALTDAPTPHMT